MTRTVTSILILVLFIVFMGGKTQLDASQKPSILKLNSGESKKISPRARITLKSVGHKITEQGDRPFIEVEIVDQNRTNSGSIYFMESTEWNGFHLRIIDSSDNSTPRWVKLEVLYLPPSDSSSKKNPLPPPPAK